MSLRTKESLVLQVIDWRCRDELIDLDKINDDNVEEDDDDDEEDEGSDEEPHQPDGGGENKKNNRVWRYMIKVFGITKDGTPVSATVTDFTPFFYVKIKPPKNNTELRNQIEQMKSLIRQTLPSYLSESLVSVSVVRKHELVGFTNNKKFHFLRVVFRNSRSMKSISNMILNKTCNKCSREKEKAKEKNTPSFKKNNSCANCKQLKTYTLYESNIEPFIRFIHCKNIRPSGWLSLTNYTFGCLSSGLKTTCPQDVTVFWKDVTSIENDESIAPLNIASFDIECSSSHGDFPLSIKRYEKFARELCIYHSSLTQEKTNTDARIRADLLRVFEHVFEVKKYPDLDDHFAKIYFKHSPPGIDKTSMYRHVDHVFEVLSDRIILVNDQPSDDQNIKTELEIFKSHFQNIKSATSTSSSSASKNNTRKSIIENLNAYFNKVLPAVEGDKVIQIGTTFHKYGQTNCYYKHVITLDSCSPIQGVDQVVSCSSEHEVLLQWTKLIRRMDPDIVTGYNIYGFDMKYLYERSQELGCTSEFSKLGRFDKRQCLLQQRELSSSALGDNIMYVLDMEGRVTIDLMKVIQRDHNLDSYKLDAVATNFMQGKVNDISSDKLILKLDNTSGISEGNHITLKNQQTKKKVLVDQVNFENSSITLSEPLILEDEEESGILSWGLAKDDISPAQIFKAQQGTSEDRALIAKYCVQDCALCNLLIIKLETIANNIGMSNVCYVPLSYIFARGQGVKIFSLVSKQCREDNILVPVIKFKQSETIDDMPSEEEEEDGYEGAIVLTPRPGIYVDEPISVMDYASLYPSSMISENISHDSLVLDPQYDNLPGISYVDITYDIYSGSKESKKKTGEKICRYAQFPNNEKGVLPRILQTLLKKRKATRKRATEKRVICHDGDEFVGYELKAEDKDTYELQMVGSDEILVFDLKDIRQVKDEHSDFMKAVLDGLQLAYKVTANSLYGQVGAKTSPIYLKELAASTTATGRNLILKAKDFMEKNYDAEIVYGDTDSIFVNFRLNEKQGLTGTEALKASIDLSVKASGEFKKACLKAPHDLEYEKTFYPFLILSKKKYVGNLFEFNVNKFKQKSMGIVLKRRDNANIVKKIYGGIIDIIMNKKNVHQAIDFLRTSLHQLSAGEFPIEDLIITKTLKGDYKDPSKIAHRVLADRMGERDPGSKPQVNDRIPFVYIQHNGEKQTKDVLQGDKIEHPSYVLQNPKKVSIDYGFYISNQLMKPISQLLSTVLLDIKEYKRKNQPDFFINKEKALLNEYNGDIKKTFNKITALKSAEIEDLFFKPLLAKLKAKSQGSGNILSLFQKMGAKMN